jgi:hypothetical protein
VKPSVTAAIAPNITAGDKEFAKPLFRFFPKALI